MKTWAIAWAFAVVAALSLAVLAWRLRPVAPPPDPPPSPAKIDDERVAAPVGWQSWPVVAHFESPREVRSSDGLFGRTSYSRAKLGPLVVGWTEDRCTAGGSACGPYIPRWHSLAAGDPGDDGAPLLGASADCEGTTPWQTDVVDTPKKRSCSLESIVLRQSAAGRIFVVSFRDPDDTDRLVVAFVRTTVRPSLGTSRGRSSLAFVAFPVVAFVAGIVLLARARGRPPRRIVWLAAISILAFAMSTVAATTMILSAP